MKIIVALAVFCLAALACDGYKIVAPRSTDVTIQPYPIIPRPRPFPSWLGYPYLPFIFPQPAVEPTEESEEAIEEAVAGNEEPQFVDLSQLPEDALAELQLLIDDAQNTVGEIQGEDSNDTDAEAADAVESINAEESVDSLPEDEAAEQEDDDVEEIVD